MDSISVILLMYFKVLNFTNFVSTTKFLKYKSLENFQLYGMSCNQGSFCLCTVLLGPVIVTFVVVYKLAFDFSLVHRKVTVICSTQVNRYPSNN